MEKFEFDKIIAYENPCPTLYPSIITSGSACLSIDTQLWFHVVLAPRWNSRHQNSISNQISQISFCVHCILWFTLSAVYTYVISLSNQMDIIEHAMVYMVKQSIKTHTKNSHTPEYIHTHTNDTMIQVADVQSLNLHCMACVNVPLKFLTHIIYQMIFFRNEIQSIKTVRVWEQPLLCSIISHTFNLRLTTIAG